MFSNESWSSDTNEISGGNSGGCGDDGCNQ